MDKQFWQQRWLEDRIGFHRDDVHPDLVRFSDLFAAGARRALVPLCGKSRDLVHLADAGMHVVGVEFVPSAVEAFHRENDIEAQVSDQGGMRVFRSPRFSIHCGDFFEVSPATVGPVDRIWDRAALVALDGPQRARYARHLRSFAQPGTLLLVNVLEYDQSAMHGPPFSVSREELETHYGDLSITELRREDGLDDHWRQLGHEWLFEGSYLIRF